LDDASDDAPKEWAQVRELADQADKYLDDDRQDEALFRRAQANLVALQLFEDSGQRTASAEADDSDEGDGDTGEHDQDGDAD
jgi:hypothetical protein